MHNILMCTVIYVCICTYILYCIYIYLYIHITNHVIQSLTVKPPVLDLPTLEKLAPLKDNGMVSCRVWLHQKKMNPSRLDLFAVTSYHISQFWLAPPVFTPLSSVVSAAFRSGADLKWPPNIMSQFLDLQLRSGSGDHHGQWISLKSLPLFWGLSPFSKAPLYIIYNI